MVYLVGAGPGDPGAGALSGDEHIRAAAGLLHSVDQHLPALADGQVMQDLCCRLHAARDLRVEDGPDARPAPDEALIRVSRGGICGSDLHYYHDGGFGPVRVQEPIILGHEAAGIVEAAPEGSGLVAGQIVALCPSRPCGTCGFCRAGQTRHCLAMRFNGSAMRMNARVSAKSMPPSIHSMALMRMSTGKSGPTTCRSQRTGTAH